MIKKVDFNTIIIDICWFLLLVYPFNCTIFNKFYSNTFVLILNIFLPIMTIFLLSYIRKIKKYQLIIVIIILGYILLFLINNYYIIEKRYFYIIVYLLYLIFPFLLSYGNEKIIKSFEKIMCIFFIEHIVATFFVQIFHTYYVTNIIPWISNGNDENVGMLLNSWAKAGYNSGFTGHYSTNGIYLATATIYFFAKNLNKSSKKNLLLTILAFVALLFTAKRAHILFTIITCVCAYIIFNKNRFDFSKTIIKFFVSGACIVTFFIILAIFIPQITNVIDRFTKDDLLSGRNVYYDICISKWKNKPILGNGWGYFSYYYNNYLYDSYSSTYVFQYIDAHNVFYQLLCETGIIGTSFVIGIIIYVFKLTLKLLKNNNDTIVIFSLCYQLFFILYCCSGNPLYDIQCYSIYFIITGIVLGKSIKAKVSHTLK